MIFFFSDVIFIYYFFRLSFLLNCLVLVLLRVGGCLVGVVCLWVYVEVEE